MCTVSFIPIPDGCILTSNRDEHILRKKALPPKWYVHNQKSLLYPKDSEAGGTWFAISKDTGEAAVLLNGAFEKHDFNPPYRKSRGLILLELLSETSVTGAWQNFDLDDIEPFTMIYYQKPILNVWVWDGIAKNQINPDAGKAHIWSSATLYDASMRQVRNLWFESFIKQNAISPDHVMQFHKSAGMEDPENGLIIKRPNGVMTQSITQAVLSTHQKAIHYENLQDDSVHILYA